MVVKSINIREDQEDFINSKSEGRKFRLSAFVRNKLDEWMEKCQKEN